VIFLYFLNKNYLIYTDMLKEPVIPGKLCQIEIYRGFSDLGLHLVGGCDTALVK
jgi:hypothetical protein